MGCLEGRQEIGNSARQARAEPGLARQEGLRRARWLGLLCRGWTSRALHSASPTSPRTSHQTPRQERETQKEPCHKGPGGRRGGWLLCLPRWRFLCRNGRLVWTLCTSIYGNNPYLPRVCSLSRYGRYERGSRPTSPQDVATSQVIGCNVGCIPPQDYYHIWTYIYE